MSRKKILIGSGVVLGCAALVGGVSHALDRMLVRLALDRTAPYRAGGGAQRRLSGDGAMANAQRDAAAAAERLAAAPHERVEITSRDGLKLVGHWFPCEGARRSIVAMHGWRSGWAKDFGIIAAVWEREGCNVLYAEQRAQGESEGTCMGFGMLERYDCADWVNWVNERVCPKLPICLAGVSMGATTVLMASALPLPENVCSVIADCGFTSAHAIWKHVTERNLHLRYGGLRKAAVETLCSKKLQLRPGDYSTQEALRANEDIPVLLIHGAADRFVPVEMSFENYEACAASKQLLIVPGAGHGMSYFVERERYEAAVRQLWLQSEAGTTNSACGKNQTQDVENDGKSTAKIEKIEKK